jgi:hypothetical protein
MDDIIAAAVAGGVVSMVATALWIDTMHARAWRDIRAVRSELRVLRHEVSRHVPLKPAGSDGLPVSPKWFEPDFPTLLRLRARTAAAVAPVSRGLAGTAG